MSIPPETPPTPVRPAAEPFRTTADTSAPQTEHGNRAPDCPQDDAPHTQPTKSESEQPATAAAEPASPTRKSRRAGVLLDIFLVLLLVGVLVGGTCYLRKEWDKYRVPGAEELAQKQCLELCAKREALQDAANRADEQLHKRSLLVAREHQLTEFAKKAEKVRNSIKEQRKRVLALQHEIRQADREARNAARGMLPGLPIGEVTTRRGRTYRNATISQLRGGRISLRTPDGGASFALSELTRTNLPDIVLYALGEIDLVDTSDFTADGVAPDTPPPNGKLRPISADTVPRRRPQDYETPGNGPVVDTEANDNTINVHDDSPGSGTQPAPGGVWQAPDGDLPL